MAGLGSITTPVIFNINDRYTHLDNEYNSWVKYNNKTYVTINVPPKGITPDLEPKCWFCVSELGGGGGADGNLNYYGEWDSNKDYPYEVLKNYPTVIYKSNLYAAIEKPTKGLSPENNAQWNLLSKSQSVLFGTKLVKSIKAGNNVSMNFNDATGELSVSATGGGGSVDAQLPLKMVGDNLFFTYDDDYFQVYPDDPDEPSKAGSFTFSQDWIVGIANNIAEAQSTADNALQNAKASIKKINAKSSEFIKLTSTEIDKGGSVDLTAELIKIPDSPTIQLYDLGIIKTPIYNPSKIPNIKNFVTKNDFPGQTIYISVQRIMDSFNHDKDCLLFVTSTDKIETTLFDGTTRATIAANPLTATRVYTNGMDTKALRVTTDYWTAQIDVTTLLASPDTYDGNEVLITVESKYGAKPTTTIPRLPIWNYSDKDDPRVTWHKDNLLGYSFLPSTDLLYFTYDSTLYHMYGNEEVRYNLDFAINQFTSPNWTKTLFFKDVTEYDLTHEHTLYINITTQGKVKSPYKVMSRSSYTLKIPVPKTTQPITMVTLKCIDNNIFLYYHNISQFNKEIAPYSDLRIPCYKYANPAVVNTNPADWGIVKDVVIKKPIMVGGANNAIYVCFLQTYYHLNNMLVGLMIDSDIRKDEGLQKDFEYGLNPIYWFEVDTKNRMNRVFNIENDFIKFTIEANNLLQNLGSGGKVFAKINVNREETGFRDNAPANICAPCMNEDLTYQPDIVCPVTEVSITKLNVEQALKKCWYNINFGLSKYKAGDTKVWNLTNNSEIDGLDVNMTFRCDCLDTMNFKYIINGSSDRMGVKMSSKLVVGQKLQIKMTMLTNVNMKIELI